MSRSVIFVAPFPLESTLRFVRAVAGLEGIELGIISQEAPERFPRAILERTCAFERVGDALDPDVIARATSALGARLGGETLALVGILEPLQETLGEVRERLGIRGMARGTARNFRDKARMKRLFEQHDLPCAAHGRVTSAVEAVAFAEPFLTRGCSLVAKPPDGAGARATLRIDRQSDLESYLRSNPPSPERPLLLEEFLRGSEHSFDAVSVGGEVVFHSISRYAPTPLEVMSTPWIQWTVLLPRRIDGPEYDPIRRAGSRALSVLGMVTGLAHMEWFRRDDGSIALSEVAARPPGAQFTSLLSWAHDRDFYRAWAELVVFERFEVPERRYAAGAAYLRGQGEGSRVAAVHGVEAARGELGDLVVEAKLPQPGSPRSDSYEGEGYLLLRDESTERVEAGLRRAVELLRVELAP